MLRSSILRAGGRGPPKVSTPSTQSVMFVSLWPLSVSTALTGDCVRNNMTRKLLVTPARSSQHPPAGPPLLRVSGAEQRSQSGVSSLCQPLSLLRSGEMWARLARWGQGCLSETTRCQHAISSVSSLLLWAAVCISCCGDQSERRALCAAQSSRPVLTPGQSRSSSWRPATRLANFLSGQPQVFTLRLIFCTMYRQTTPHWPPTDLALTAHLLITSSPASHWARTRRRVLILIDLRSKNSDKNFLTL